MKSFKILIAIVCIILFSKSTFAHPINADLSTRQIKINSDFNGLEVLIFGALDVKGDIIILVHGAKRSIAINKKEKQYGFWINGKRDKIHDTKQFYTISSTKELNKITSDEILNSIRIDDLNFSTDQELSNAFKKMKQKSNLYLESESNIDLINEKLFRSNIHFPNNIPHGRYTIEVLLFYNQNLFGIQTMPLLVSRAGIESFIFDMHYLHPFLYALCSVIVALFIGWSSSLVKKR